MVVLEGTDGKGQHYVSQVLVDRSTNADDVDGLQVQEPAFWLGTAYTALQHGRSWDGTSGDASRREQHDTRARRACTDTATWLEEVAR